MAVASGTSVIGLQTLLNDVVVSSRQMSIHFPARNQPPVARMGYFWLYTYNADLVRQHYLIESDIAHAPGVYIPIRIPPFSATWRYRLDVVWGLPGISWVATVI